MARQKRTYRNMSYREVQRSNSTRRQELMNQHQLELKSNGYRNVGWDNVIALYEEITRLQHLDGMTLEELYLEADRIGNKYQTKSEIADYRQALAAEVNAISQTLDSLFPPSPREEIDFSRSRTTKRRSRRK